MDDCAERATLAWARDDPREAFFSSHNGALRDYAATVVVGVGRVAYYVEYFELLRFSGLGIRHIDDVGSDDLYFLDACAAADLLELLLTLDRLDGMPTDLEDAVSSIWFLLTARRLTLSECIVPDRALLLLVEYELL